MKLLRRHSSGEEQDCDNFDSLIDLLCGAKGCAVLLSAYFDASERPSGIFSVAGLAFGPKNAKKANRAWARLWGDVQCHMTDLHTRKPNSQFERWTRDQAGDRLRESISIINKRVTRAVAVSCDISEIQRLAPKHAAPGCERYLDGASSAYATCCHIAMQYLGGNQGVGGIDSEIAYFFETGDRNQAEANRFMSFFTSIAETRRMYSYHSHTFIEKKNCRLMEMADIFAWEWAKHVERVHEGKGMRPSLYSLLNLRAVDEGVVDYSEHARRAIHITGAPLEKYFAYIRKNIVEIE